MVRAPIHLRKYVGLRAATPTLLHTTTRYVATTTDTTTLGVRARIGSAQLTGAYSGTITLTAIANP